MENNFYNKLFDILSSNELCDVKIFSYPTLVGIDTFSVLTISDYIDSHVIREQLEKNGFPKISRSVIQFSIGTYFYVYEHTWKDSIMANNDKFVEKNIRFKEKEEREKAEREKEEKEEKERIKSNCTIN